MGLLRDWINEMGSTWNGMAEGDAGSFIGVPQKTRGTGTGHGGTGTGHSSTPDVNALSVRQKKMLRNFFHEQYGRYPLTEFEFQQWLEDNW